MDSRQLQKLLSQHKQIIQQVNNIKIKVIDKNKLQIEFENKKTKCKNKQGKSTPNDPFNDNILELLIKGFQELLKSESFKNSFGNLEQDLLSKVFKLNLMGGGSTMSNESNMLNEMMKMLINNPSMQKMVQEKAQSMANDSEWQRTLQEVTKNMSINQSSQDKSSAQNNNENFDEVLKFTSENPELFNKMVQEVLNNFNKK